MVSQARPVMTLRWLESTHLPIVWPLVRSSTARPWTRRGLEAHFRDQFGNGIWVEERGQALALLLYCCDLTTKSHHLVDVGVRPDRRRRGMGRLMMAAFQRHVRSMPSKGIGALLSERALEGQLFLRACGFRAVAVMRGTFEAGLADGYWFEWP